MADAQGKKILIVDDEEDIVELLAEEFEDCGYNVTTGNSVNQAIACLQKDEFDLILSDFRMPDGNGMDLLTYVNSMESGIRPKFFFLSGYSDIPQEELIKAGALHFFTKPFQLEEIITQIEEFF